MSVTESDAIASPAAQPTRPLYWSVRRELWENRSLYIAPLAIAVILLFGFMISTVGLPHRRRAAMLLDPPHRRAAMQIPYDEAAAIILVVACLVAFFYCLDALHGERRERTILFWKSLPVSDWTTVLSKMAVPLVVLPTIGVVIIMFVQLFMLFFSTAILLMAGLGEAAFPHLPFAQMTVALVYVVITASLWLAPIYAWLLLISAWARKATFLWAVLPPAALAMFERIAFHTSYVGSFIHYRMGGWFAEAVAAHKGALPVDPLAALTPGRYFSAPGLWFGLIFAALFLAGAMRLRRTREPL